MSTPTILVIDDDENVRYSLAMILQKEGFLVRTANGGHTGLGVMCLEHIDLVFLDLSLPDINGLSLLPKIRQRYPDLPILILTATPPLCTEREAAGYKVQGYLTKPIDPAVILGYVREILAKPPS